jgi:hypothetical protein
VISIFSGPDAEGIGKLSLGFRDRVREAKTEDAGTFLKLNN